MVADKLGYGALGAECSGCLYMAADQLRHGVLPRDGCIWSQTRHAKQYSKIVYMKLSAKIKNLYVK